MKRLYWIPPNDKTHAFPAVEQAFRDPNGLLAAGGDLAPARLIEAYRNGIFPWYGEGEPILWWSPDPRAVLFPQRLKISRSLRKTIRKGEFTLTADMAFRHVMQACAAPRGDGMGTWIAPEMIEAYNRLHEMGIAHSVEAWRNGELAGGLYGVALGRMFFGESMFSRASDASKVAFVHLVRQLERWGYAAIDCQIHSTHLQTLGAENIDRTAFIGLLEQWRNEPGHPAPWRLDDDLPLI